MEKIPYAKFSEILDVVDRDAVGRADMNEWAKLYFEDDFADGLATAFGGSAALMSFFGASPSEIVSVGMTGFHLGFELAKTVMIERMEKIWNDAREFGDISKRETFLVAQFDLLIREMKLAKISSER